MLKSKTPIGIPFGLSTHDANHGEPETSYRVTELLLASKQHVKDHKAFRPCLVD